MADGRVSENGKGMVNPGDTLVAFVHVPKTAGATVKGMLANAYSRPALHDAGNFFGKDPETTARKIQHRGGWEAWQSQGGRVTAGHVPYGLLREHLPSETRYLTFLREPVARVLSHYNRHFRPNRVNFRPRKAKRLESRGRKAKSFESLEQALTEVRDPRLTNLATRLLCGDPSPTGELAPSAVEDAKENLRDFMFVGITERFDESAALLQRRLGVHAVPYGARQHVNPHGRSVGEVTDRERAVIEEHNQLDLELYEFARDLFEDAAAAAGGIAVEAEALRRLGAAADEEAESKTRDACAWLERALPVGIPRPVEEVRAEAVENGIEKRHLDRAKRILEVDGVRSGEGEPCWLLTTVTTESAREWLEEALPVGATRPTVELRAAAAGAGIPKRKFGRAALLLGAEEVADGDGEACLTRTDASRSRGSA